MLDFFQIKQHRIVFSILAILVGIAIICFIALFIFNLINQFNGEIPEKTQNTIAFTGQGKIYTKPDIAFIDFSVVTQGEEIGRIQDANTKKMNKVIEFLKSFGIEEKDIKTTNYNLYPQYVYENSKIPQIMGYQITQTLNVKVRQMDKIGEILEKVVNIGINQVNALYFGVENDEELKEQARKLAIDDAKKKAEKLSQELGIKLGKLSNFSENVAGYPTYREYYGYGVGGGGGAPDIQTGENEIIVNVTLTYQVR
jgi:uncharacterized protein YggE